MKKVLIIANLFHASPRIPGISSYLPEFGWEATIVTPDLGNDSGEAFGFPKQFLSATRIVKTPYRGDIFWFWRKGMNSLGFKKNKSLVQQVKANLGVTSRISLVDRLFYFYQELFAYPDTEITWEKTALRVTRELLRHEKFDVILSSSPFPTSHVVAAKIAKEANLKWVADFRDPWTQNHNYPFSNLRRTREEKYEKKIISGADAIVAAAPAYADKQREFHGRPVAVVTNGFDPENFDVLSRNLPGIFTVLYTGTIYSGKQDPRKVLEAIRELINEGRIDKKRFNLLFYGPLQDWLEKDIQEMGLSEVVIQRGTISRCESISKQREAHLLLLLNWEDKNEFGVHPSKIFEYFSAKRPIIATGGFIGDDVQRMINEADAGIYVVSPMEIKEAFADYYEEYIKTGTVAYLGKANQVLKYSYRQSAAKIGNILDSLANNPN